MPAVAWFLVVLGAIALIGWIVSKGTGSRTWPVDDWPYDKGETIVWRDDAAYVALIPKLGQSKVMRPPRLHRWKVITTTTRVIMATKAIGGKYIVVYVLYPGHATGEDSRKIDGGLLTTGYQTIVVVPGAVTAQTNDGYVTLEPDPSEPSSTNVAEVRIYTDLLTTFCLP